MTDYQIAIIGGGLAGCLAAQALLKRWPILEIAVFHDESDSTSASENRAALTHALPGRRLMPKPFQVEAYRASVAFLDEGDLSKKCSLRKILPDGKAKDRYLKDLDDAQTIWSPEGIKLSLSDDKSALDIAPARVVDLKALCEEIRSQLFEEGRLISQRARVTKEEDGFLIQTQREKRSYRAQKVVFAGGATLFRDQNLKGAVEKEGGETVAIAADISGAQTRRGAYVVQSDAGLRLGATHRECGVARPAIEIAHELWARFGDAQSECPAASDVFYGERAFVRRDRLPICGAIADNSYILSALGSTGLLWAPFLAECLAREILDQTPSPPIFCPTRAGAAIRLV